MFFSLTNMRNSWALLAARQRLCSISVFVHQHFGLQRIKWVFNLFVFFTSSIERDFLPLQTYSSNSLFGSIAHKNLTFKIIGKTLQEHNCINWIKKINITKPVHISKSRHTICSVASALSGAISDCNTDLISSIKIGDSTTQFESCDSRQSSVDVRTVIMCGSLQTEMRLTQSKTTWSPEIMRQPLNFSFKKYLHNSKEF